MSAAAPEPVVEDGGPPQRPGEGAAPEAVAEEARKKNKRQLASMLRKAREALAHHGKRSFMGREAKKRIRAAEDEFRRRGLPVPPE